MVIDRLSDNGNRKKLLQLAKSFLDNCFLSLHNKVKLARVGNGRKAEKSIVKGTLQKKIKKLKKVVTKWLSELTLI